MPTFSSQRLLFGLILVLVVLSDAKAQDRVVTETTLGTLIGESTREGDTRISVFRGIPYALPPVGERRWKPTEAATAWDYKRLAIAFAPACMHPIDAEESFYYAQPPLMSEDCLYLNVWTEAELPSSKTRPVMVYIHGGALIHGFGDLPLYDGASLARKGVVVVTINYRLNVFGYFAHEELNEESPMGASGNYGTLDQIQALRWIQENISAFGGDPDNVTIWGESAGALSVSHLMATPLSQGLFHRAIMQSPYMPPSLLMNQGRFGKGSAVSQGAKLGEAAGVTSLAGLRALPAAELLQISRSIGLYPETVVDGYVFPEDIHEVFARGGQQNVPLLAGFNSGEVNAFADLPGLDLVPPVPEDAAHYVAEVQTRFGDLSDEYLALYPVDDIRASVFAASRDGFFSWATEGFVRKMDKVNASRPSDLTSKLQLARASSGSDAFVLESILGTGSCSMGIAASVVRYLVGALRRFVGIQTARSPVSDFIPSRACIRFRGPSNTDFHVTFNCAQAAQWHCLNPCACLMMPNTVSTHLRTA